MTENPDIIKLNIAHLEATLKRDMSNERRSMIARLLAEAHGDLALATALRKPSLM